MTKNDIVVNVPRENCIETIDGKKIAVPDPRQHAEGGTVCSVCTFHKMCTMLNILIELEKARK